MYLKKSLLALAISVAATNAFAESVSLNGAPYVGQPTYEGGLILSGEVSGTGNPVALNGTTIKGDFANNAKITTSGANSIGLLMDGSTLGDKFLDADSFTNKFDQNGNIAASGTDSIAMKLHNVYGSSLKIAQGTSITATGVDSTGMHLSGILFSGVIDNSGVISGEHTGLELGANNIGNQDSTLRYVDNSGSILATDANGTALVLYGATFYSIDDHLVNTGTIKGGKAGIDFERFTLDTDPTQPQEIGKIPNKFNLVHEKGLISGGQYSIRRANDRVDLVWGNDKSLGEAVIEGNIEGLADTQVIGPVQFHGTMIDSQHVSVNGGATLNLNNAHTTIDGDLKIKSNGQLGLPMSGETIAEVPVLKVTGSATLENGAKVLIVAKGSDFAAGGKSYHLIDAGTLDVADNVTFKSSSALLQINDFTVEGGKLKVKVSTAGAAGGADAGFEQLVRRGGGNTNAVNAGQQFMTVAGILGQNNPADPVLTALANAGTDEQAIAGIMKQLSPEANGGAAAAAMGSQNLVSGVISTRSSNLRGQSSGEMFDGTGFWMQALSSESDQGVRSGIDGYEADSKGITFGADRKLNNETTLGLAYSFVNTDVKSDIGNKTEVDSHLLTAYSTWARDNLFVEGGVSYGINKNDSTRYIQSTQATADYDSEMIGLNVMAGFGFHTSYDMLIEPRIAARYNNVKIDGFTEKGSSAALTTGDQRLEVGEIGAGVRLAGAFDLGKGTLEPEFNVMTYHDVIGDKTSSTSAFILGGNAFVTNGATPSRESYEVGFGATYKLGALSVGGSYDRIMKTGFDADTFTAKLRYDF